MLEFKEGQIVEFIHPVDGTRCDGVVWRVLPEDETNVSLFVRFVDEV